MRQPRIRVMLAAALSAASLVPPALAQPAAGTLRPTGAFANFQADTFGFQVPAEWIAAGPDPGSPRGLFTGPLEAVDGGTVLVTLEFDRFDDGTTVADVVARARRRAAGDGAVDVRVVPVDGHAGPGARISCITPHHSGPPRRVVYALPLRGGTLATFTWTYPASSTDYASIAERVARSAAPPAAQPEPWVCRSSQLGVEFTLPAGWRRGTDERILRCGTVDAVELPRDEQVLRIGEFSLAGAAGPDRTGVEVFAVRRLSPRNDPAATYRNRAEGIEATPFAFGEHQGERFTWPYGRIYLALRPPGAVWVHAYGPADQAAALDAVAASLRFFPPEEEEPCDAAVTKTYHGPGFAFDFPGNFTFWRPLEEGEHARATGSLGYCGPRPSGQRLRSVSFRYGVGPDHEPLTPDQAEATLPTYPNPEKTVLRTQVGLPVRRLVMAEGNNVLYIVELPDGGSFIFSGHPFSDAPSRAVLDALVASFRTQPLPWDESGARTAAGD